MTKISDSDNLDRVLRIIRARCGDVLSDADLAALAETASFQAVLPVASRVEREIGEQIMEVLDAMMTRMDAIERAVSPN